MIQLRNENTGEVVFAPQGFSWTFFFFGFFVPLFRGDFLYFCVAFFVILPFNFLTFGFAQVIFAFFYNNLYFQKMINKGFVAIV